MIEFEKTILKNGVRILTAPLHETKAMTLQFLVGTGSRNERAEENGISHFLEHILFKGTEKYPLPIMLAETLDGIGAEFNAFTGEEYTGFYVNAEASHFPLALDVLSQMFYHATFKHDDVEREKGVILEERNMYLDLPQRHVWDILKNMMYGDTPLGRNIVGEPETVMAFNHDMFLNYQRDCYTPENIIVSVAGNPNGVDWIGDISKVFGEKPAAKARPFEKAHDEQSSPQARSTHRKTDQTHFVLAYRTFPQGDERRFAMSVLSTILGGTMSSRLFNEIREKRGLAYYVRSSADGYHDAGHFAISAGVNNKQAAEAIKVTLAEVERLKSELVSDAELSRAKENFRGRLALQLEESSAVGNYLAEQELYLGKQVQPEELVEKVSTVTAKQIQDLANEFFVPERANLAAVGPFTNDELSGMLTSK